MGFQQCVGKPNLWELNFVGIQNVWVFKFVGTQIFYGTSNLWVSQVCG